MSNPIGSQDGFMTTDSVIKYLLVPEMDGHKQVALALFGLDIEKEDVSVSVVKADDSNDERLVYGIVLRPNRIDGHMDIMTAEEVQKTAHFYMAVGGIMGDGHSEFAEAIPVESYIAPVDFMINGQEVKMGDWILVSFVVDDELWERIKSGEVAAYSPGGVGRKIAI